MRSKHSDGGFTLIELMVTVACMAILGAVAVPRLQGYILDAHLSGAKPYLMEVAAKERMYKIETGKYCCTAYDGLNEDTLATTLPASVAETGDFCFVFVCLSSTLCEAPTASRSFVDSTSTPEFEVWAVLRSTTPTVSGTSCNVANGKAAATGWVQSSTSALAGRAGELVALRYPPPPNGPTASLSWTDGISATNALLP